MVMVSQRGMSAAHMMTRPRRKVRDGGSRGEFKDAVQLADHRSSFQFLQYYTPADRHRAERERARCIASAYCRIVAEEARDEGR
jgi:hypothetical protein